MPNHVQNILKFNCNDKQLKRIFEKLKSKGKNDNEELDFNKIIRMPQSLDVESGTTTEKYMNLYLTAVNPDTEYHVAAYPKLNKLIFDELCDKLRKNVFLECSLSKIDIENTIRNNKENEILRIGQTVVNNVVKYGFTDWYGWRLENWGTKWNAYSVYKGDDYIEFQTAWSAPHPVIDKLSEIFPDVEIEHSWADEDIGSNCGRITYYHGKRIEEYYPDNGKDGTEFAISVWGDLECIEENWGLKLNASHNNYIYLNGEEYELIEYKGEPALFSNSKLNENDIPDGMYCYPIRGSDTDSGALTTIEKLVIVNYAGTIILKQKIDFKGNDFINIGDDINFLGEQKTFSEFIEYVSDNE